MKSQGSSKHQTTRFARPNRWRWIPRLCSTRSVALAGRSAPARGGLSIACIVVSVCWLLVSCAEKGQPASPPPLRLGPLETERPGPPAPPPEPPVSHAAWTGDDAACPGIVRLRGSGFGLKVPQPDASSIVLTAAMSWHGAPQSRRISAATMKFTGFRGSWQLAGWLQGNTSVFRLRADDDALGRILALLSGGTIEIGYGRRVRKIVTVPTSGTLGEKWFECARSKII